MLLKGSDASNQWVRDAGRRGIPRTKRKRLGRRCLEHLRLELLWISAGLVAMVAVVYARVWGFAFVNFDDPDYVNTSGRGLLWAFTSVEAANWFPVTRLSHMADGLLFGMQSGWHHAMNVVWHAAATVTLFAFLQRATGARWRSAFVAFRFRAASPARGIGGVGCGAQGCAERVLLVPDPVVLCALHGAAGSALVLVHAGGVRGGLDGEADDGDSAAGDAAAGSVAARGGGRGGRRSRSSRLRRRARSPRSWCSGVRARSASL